MKLKEILSDPSTSIVDVRTIVEFAEDHLPHAINIPLDQVETHISEFKNMSKPIIVYCRSGNRSEMAKNILRRNGINDVLNGGSLYDLQQSLRA